MIKLLIFKKTNLVALFVFFVNVYSFCQKDYRIKTLDMAKSFCLDKININQFPCKVGDTILLERSDERNKCPSVNFIRAILGDQDGFNTWKLRNHFAFFLTDDLKKGDYTLIDIEGTWKIQKKSTLVLKNVKIYDDRFIFIKKRKMQFKVSKIDESFYELRRIK